MDGKGNIWGTSDNNYNLPLSVFNGNQSRHFSIGESGGVLSNNSYAISADNFNRVWVSSSSKLVMYKYSGDVMDPTSEVWLEERVDPGITMRTPLDINVSSKNRLWILTPIGLIHKDLQVSDTNPVSQTGPTATNGDLFPYFPNVVFNTNSRIRFDPRGNVWVTSEFDGIHIVTENGEYWPDINGLNESNSNLLSNHVNDVTFNGDEGLAYIATNKGVSVFRIPFSEEKKSYNSVNIFPSPFRIPSSTPMTVEGLKDETNARRGPMTYDRISQTMKWLKEAGVLFGFSSMATKENIELLGSEEFIDHWMEKGCKFGWVFQYIPIGRCPDVGLMATPEQRVQLRKNVENIREKKPFFLGDFWNDGHYVYGCMAGGKTYLHITNNGSVEPCVFAHFSVDNINDKSLVEVLNSDFFKAVRDSHPHSKNKNLLSPCMIIDHPEVLRKLVKEHGAKGTHKEEEQIVNDEKVKKHLDEYSKKVLEITDKEWEGPYHKFFKHWFVDHKGRYD